LAEQPAVNRQVLGSSPSQGAIIVADGSGESLFNGTFCKKPNQFSGTHFILRPMPLVKTQIRTVVGSWRNQSPAVRVIRLWLGVTWIYAGWNKATDPGFLRKTGRDYIGKQLSGYAQHSPLGFFFRHLIERATMVGILVTVSEFAIGLATLFWVAPTLMAFIGFTMSIGLWVAATWHVKPYFLGSDSVYAVLWLSYLLTLIGKRRKVDALLDRRGALRVGVLGVVVIAATFVGNIFFKPSTANSVSTALGVPISGASRNQIIKLTSLAIGQTHEFATSDGQPAVLFRTYALTKAA
jgi:thiosulfate dehydrogenase [quinone] large subunit